MARSVLLLGGECTGKSSLASALVTQADAVAVPEYLRTFVDRRGRTPTVDEQVTIWGSQRAALAYARDHSPADGLIVCDPAPLMTAVYSIQYFQEASLFATATEAGELDADLWVWCQPDIPWVADELHHDGPQARSTTHQLIEDLVIPRLPNDSIVRVEGTLENRVHTVRTALERGGRGNR